jgi:hypothetical protein
MHHTHHHHHHGRGLQVENREAEPLDHSAPLVPEQDAVLVSREKCGDGECTKPVSTTTTMTMPIVLGAVYVDGPLFWDVSLDIDANLFLVFLSHLR